MRKCEYCKKQLKRKKWKSGYLEPIQYFRKRKFCNLKCSNPNTILKRGDRLWTLNSIKKEFHCIKDRNKYNSVWLRVNHNALETQIKKKYGGLCKFLYSINKQHKLSYDSINPKYKVLAKEILNYWKTELDYKKGDIFGWSVKYWLEGVHLLQVEKAQQYLKRKKVIRLIKRGDYGKTSKGRLSQCSTYKLLKTRV